MHGRQFEVMTRDIETGKRTSILFKTLNEAVAAKEAERSKWEEHKQGKLARPREEIRAENVATYGNSLKLERDFVLHLHNTDEKFEVMNDFVLSDVCAFLYEDCALALGSQLKVSSGPIKGGNAWVFCHVRGYTGMPVVCWRADMQDGWVFDGAVLDKRGKENVWISPGGVNANLALSGKHPLRIDALIEFLKGDKVAGDRERFPPHSKEFLSWQFGGKKAHNHLKERIGIYLYQTHIDKLATFPQSQAGSYDLLSVGKRQQFKTARFEKGHTGLQVTLQESAGHVDGKATHRPYSSDAFDELVVYYLDWKEKAAHMWRIPASELVRRGYLRTDTQAGKQTISVFKSNVCLQSKKRRGVVPDTWTEDYYHPTTLSLEEFPAEVEAAAGHLLDAFRAPKVVI